MKQFLVLLFTLVALSHMASGTYFTGDNVNSFIDRLEEEGFIVQQGMFGGFDLLDLFANYIVPDCSGNNADNPYCVYFCHPHRLRDLTTACHLLSGFRKTKHYYSWDGLRQR